MMTVMLRCTVWVVMTAAAAAVAAHPRADSPDDAIRIANTTQLLVDDFIIHSVTNLSRSMHSPDATQVAIVADAPWEHGFTVATLGTSVLLDDGVIRVWYGLRRNALGCGDGDEPPCSAKLPPQPNYEANGARFAYAESHDFGKTFVKPALHRVSINGSTANNVIAPVNGTAWDTPSIFIDPTQPPGSARRYRAVQASSSPDVLESANGIDWRRSGSFDIPASVLAQGSWGRAGGFDTQSVAFFDPPCDCWSFYTRFKNWENWEHGTPPPALGNYRMVRRAQSKTITPTKPNPPHLPWLGTWVNQSVVMRADALDNRTHSLRGPAPHVHPVMDYYGVTPWYSAEADLYFAAFVRFWHWGRALGNWTQGFATGMTSNQPGTYDLALASSRDGEHFTFVERTPWMRPGVDGSVRSRKQWLAPPGPIRVDNQELFFVTGDNVAEWVEATVDPKSPKGWQSEIAVGRLRLNGLVSLDAGYTTEDEAAVLVTKPLIFAGQRLQVNLDAGGGGSLIVEVHDAAASPSSVDNAYGGSRPPLLASLPLSFNAVDLVVMWESRASILGNATAVAAYSGMPVRLVMRMQDCQLYGFRFVNGENV